MSFSITGGTPVLGSVVGEANCITDWITILCATNTMDPAGQSGKKCQANLSYMRRSDAVFGPAFVRTQVLVKICQI